jgi:hypothetical protein
MSQFTGVRDSWSVVTCLLDFSFGEVAKILATSLIRFSENGETQFCRYFGII